MKTTIQRLLSGFISSIMVVSFILMPIPNISVSYAEEAEQDCPTDEEYKAGAVYVPGCEFTEALSTTSFDSSARYSDGKKVFGIIPQGMVEQYIVGLMGVILINSLRWKYLPKYNPYTYGNDCPQNQAASFAMPIAALAGLSYVIGDVQANIKFKKSAKQAADDAFSAKAKEYIPSDDSDEAIKAKEAGEKSPALIAIENNNKQLQAYDKLLEVLEAQEKALKTKQALSTVASVGYGLADAAELVFMGVTIGICTKQWGEIGVDQIKQAQEYATSMSTVTALLSGPQATVNASCAALEVALNTAVGAQKGAEGGKQANGAKKSLWNMMKSGLQLKNFAKILTGIKKFFSPGASDEVMSSEFDKLIGDESVDKGVEAADNGVQIADESTGSALKVPEQTAGKTLGGAIAACPQAKAVVDQYYSGYTDYASKIVKCCGGAGVTPAFFIAQNGIDKAKLPSLYDATKALKKKAMDQGIWEAVKAAVDADGLKIEFDLKEGTYLSQGVPKKSTTYRKKDIKVLNLFESGKSASNDLNNNMRFYVENVFESNLRELAISTLINYDLKNPKKTIRNIAVVNRKVDNVMAEYRKLLDKEFDNMFKNETININGLAFKKFLKKFADELSISSAHAGMGGAVVGAGLSMVAGQIDGPWSEVLNVGGKILTLHGILGGFAKRTALTMPITRALTWTTLGTLSVLTASMTKKAKEKVQENIKVVETEKKRFEESTATRTSLAKGSGGGELNLRTHEYTANTNGLMNIKACATPSGNGFAPAMCPAVVPKSRFSIPELKVSKANHLTPDHMKGMGLLTDITFGASTGSMDVSNMDSAELQNIEKVSKAIAKANDSLRDRVDKHDSSIKGRDSKGGGSLPANIAKIRKVLLGTSSDSSLGSSLASTPTSSGSGSMQADKKEESTPTVSGGGGAAAGGAAPVAAVPSLDLDFGDDAGVAVDNSGDGLTADSNKKEEKLEDFVLKHDDINKKKDVSIFKILSNRYILSYPKVLEEETAKSKQ